MAKQHIGTYCGSHNLFEVGHNFDGGRIRCHNIRLTDWQMKARALFQRAHLEDVRTAHAYISYDFWGAPLFLLVVPHSMWDSLCTLLLNCGCDTEILLLHRNYPVSVRKIRF